MVSMAFTTATMMAPTMGIRLMANMMSVTMMLAIKALTA